MGQWNGNNVIFRGYFFGKGKAPERGSKIKGAAGYSFAEVWKADCFGAVMRERFIDISFDDPAMSKKFLEMAEENQWLCMVLENPDNGHIHTFWRNSRNRITKKSAVDQKLAVGLVADIHGGDTYIPLCVDGVGRFPPKYDIFDGEDYQEVPEELLPVNTKIDLWDLKGGNRNNALSGMAKYLVYNSHFTKEQITRIITNANSFVLNEPVNDDELGTILRDETFEGMESDAESKLRLVCLERVEVREVDFLYKPQIPKGKVVIIGAHPGTGKTFIACYLAACVSKGIKFFDIPYMPSEPGKVVYITTEDGIADTIVPRLMWCGADLSKIYTFEDPKGELKFSNIDVFDTYLDQVKPALMILDPFQSFLGGQVDGNSANEIRALLNPVIALAERHDTTIVFICHYNKNNHGDTITRILGSMDTMATARSYLALGNVPGDQLNTKYMSHEKSSTQAAGQTVLFRIDPDKGGVVFAGTSSLKQSDYTSLAAGRKDDTASIFEAKMLIMENMTDGRCEVKEIKELAKANGISERTLQRARADMQLKVVRESFGGKYFWEKTDVDIDVEKLEEDAKKCLPPYKDI